MDSNQNITVEDQDSIPTDSCCYIGELPVEVLAYLMEFLSHLDRLVARQVCQQWYRASLLPKFVNRERIKITSETSSETLSVLKKTSRAFFHIVLKEIEISNEIRDVLIKLAPTLRSLYIKRCSLYEKILIDILYSCSHLKILALERCQELFMPGTLLSKPEEAAVFQSVGRLKELHVTFNRYLSDAMLVRLMNASPYLSTVSLQGCQISYHTGLLQKYYPENTNSRDFESPSGTVLTFWNFLNILSRRASVIKNINLSNTLVDSNALKALSELKDLQLEELHFAGCTELANRGVMAMTGHQKSLTVLNLTGCPRITDQSLLKICQNLINLRKLAVSDCTALTDVGVVQLKNLTHLEDLDISRCDKITGAGVEEGLCHAVNRTMLQLHMNDLNAITSNTVSLVAQKLPNLTVFSLNYCPDAVTDDSIQAIFQHQLQLQTLRLAGSENISDIGLTGMGTYEELDTVMNSVDHLAVSVQPKLHISLRTKAEEEIIRDAYRKKRVQEMCESQLTKTANVGYSVDRLKGLRVLDLQSCCYISDVCLTSSFMFPELQHLNLSMCSEITDLGIRAVVKNNPGIYSLSLEECYKITDEGIAAVTSFLHRLKFLNVKHCVLLTAASVMSVVNNCHQLRYFNATHCSGMMNKIIEMMPRLPLHTYFSRVDGEEFFEPPPPPPLPYPF